MKCVSTLPTVQYSSAIHTMKPGITNALPPTLNEKLPDRPHRMPTKLARVTTALRKPMDRPTVCAVNWAASSCRRWSGLSGARWPGTGRPLPACSSGAGPL